MEINLLTEVKFNVKKTHLNETKKAAQINDFKKKTVKYKTTLQEHTLYIGLILRVQ